MSRQQTTERLTELEIRFMDQEQTLESLSQQLYLQQQEIQQLRITLEQLSKRLHNLNVSQVAAQHEETPPPHY